MSFSQSCFQVGTVLFLNCHFLVFPCFEQGIEFDDLIIGSGTAAASFGKKFFSRLLFLNGVAPLKNRSFVDIEILTSCLVDLQGLDSSFNVTEVDEVRICRADDESTILSELRNLRKVFQESVQILVLFLPEVQHQHFLKRVRRERLDSKCAMATTQAIENFSTVKYY